MWKGQTVSVVFSTYRDVQTIRAVVEGLFATGVVDEVVAVDNNAEPGTREELARTRAKRVVEPRQGLGHGFQRALREASGDLIVTLEVDGTYRPSDVLKLLAYSDDFDVVCGTRTAALMIREGSDMGALTRWSNVLYAKLVEVLFNTANLTDVGCIFRLMKRSAWERIRDLPMDGGWAFNLDWMLHVVRSRVRFIEVPVNFLPRAGHSVGAAHSRLHAARIALRMFVIILKHRLGLVRSA
jgi:glycosyltransferase involved in cell wall biosynthesis